MADAVVEPVEAEPVGEVPFEPGDDSSSEESCIDLSLVDALQNLESAKDAKDSCNSCFRKWGALLACKKLVLRPRKIRGLNCNTCVKLGSKHHMLEFEECPP